MSEVLWLRFRNQYRSLSLNRDGVLDSKLRLAAGEGSERQANTEQSCTSAQYRFLPVSLRSSCGLASLYMNRLRRASNDKSAIVAWVVTCAAAVGEVR